MKIFYQWALRNPQDWALGDSAQWSQIPKRARPNPGDPLPNQPGLVACITVQGVEFPYSCCAVEDLNDGSGGVRITGWEDGLPTGSTGLPGPGWRQAFAWSILPLAPDAKFGGALNTRQFLTIYGESNFLALYDQNNPPVTSGGPVTFQPWTAFVRPAEAVVRYGIGMSDQDWARHVAARTAKGWRDWIS